MVYVNLDELLKEKKKSRYWLIKEIESDYNTVNKIINNESSAMTFDMVDRICDALECEPKDLIKRKKVKGNVKY